MVYESFMAQTIYFQRDTQIIIMIILITIMINNSDIIPFTPDSAKSKIDTFSKITNLVKLKNKRHHNKVLLDCFPMNGQGLLCITQGFTVSGSQGEWLDYWTLQRLDC